MTERVWTDVDYDEMSWHDAAIHGFRLIAGEDASGKLVLDIDYILEWIKAGDHFTVRRQPATLTFLDVYDLRLSLDYASCSAAFSPCSIDEIERRSEPREGYTAHTWTITINWPVGRITFTAKGFEQQTTGEARLTDAAALTLDERGK